MWNAAPVITAPSNLALSWLSSAGNMALAGETTFLLNTCPTNAVVSSWMLNVDPTRGFPVWSPVVQFDGPGAVQAGTFNSLSRNRVLLVGGEHQISSTPAGIWIFDGNAGTWTQTPLTFTLALHATIVYNDNAFVFGGLYVVNNTFSTNAYVIDTFATTIESLTFSEDLGFIPAARVYHSAALAELDGEPVMAVYGGLNSELQVLGDLWSLNLKSLTWTLLFTTAGDLSIGPPSLFLHSAAALSSRKMILVGGHTSLANPSRIARVYVFDFASRAWETPLPVLSQTLVSAPSLGVLDGTVYAFAQSTGLVSFVPACVFPQVAESYLNDSCKVCPAGTFSASCEPCPSGLTTIGAGKAFVSDCSICVPGYCGHGTCSVKESSASCECHVGYMGATCNMVSGQCSSAFSFQTLHLPPPPHFRTFCLWKLFYHSLWDCY